MTARIKRGNSDTFDLFNPAYHQQVVYGTSGPIGASTNAYAVMGVYPLQTARTANSKPRRLPKNTAPVNGNGHRAVFDREEYEEGNLAWSCPRCGSRISSSRASPRMCERHSRPTRKPPGG